MSFDYELLPAVAMVFGGCMSAIFSLEFVLKGDPQSGNLLTFTAVVAVLVQSIPSRIVPGSLRPKPLVAPLVSHLQFDLLWVSMSILANYAFAYNISVPIFTLIRSCNIVASVLLGWLCFCERYSWQQLLCVCAVSVGVFLASAGEWKTLGSAGSGKGCADCHDVGSNAENSSSADGPLWAIGISMLVIVQLIQGFLGHIQARFYTIYKDLASKHELSDEYLFTAHIAALLPFLWLWEDLAAAARAALASDPVPLPLLSFIPSRVAWLFLNNVSQVICLKGVFRASAVLSPLTLTVLLSVRKFFSVGLSICWFGNPWTHWHSVATVLIFGGAFVYSQVRSAKETVTHAKKAS